MAVLFGQDTKVDQQPALTGIPLQTSVYGKAVTVAYGRVRLAPNLIWYGDFVSRSKPRDQGGKGGGGGGGGKAGNAGNGYEYQTALEFLVCEGPISGFTGVVWQSKAKTTVAALGFTTFNGTYPQSPWGHLTTNHPSEALGYKGIALVAASAYQLGDSAQLPNHNFEVNALLTRASGDADPSAVIADILTSSHHGMGFPSARLGTLSAYQNYAIATGLLIAPVYAERQAAADIIEEICRVTNSAPVWSGGVLNIVPYGDEDITANGKTYVAPSAPIYDLTDDDFLHDEDEDPVRLARKPPAKIINSIQQDFLDRSADYNPGIVEAKDQAAIDSYGLQKDTRSGKILANGDAARLSTQLQLQREAIANQYEFRIDERFVLLI